MTDTHKFATRSIHAGQDPDPATGAIMTPIYQSSTFVQAAPGDHKGYEYARTGNPTRTALEANIASLESGAFGTCYSSGSAAGHCVLNLLSAGDHVISGRDVYGGTYRQFTKVWEKFGIEFSFVDTSDLANLDAAFRPNTKIVWMESPSNPLLSITDLAEAANMAHAHNALCVVDNTFASPFLQRPLELGADIVVHSTTKYIGGHSDVIGGAVVTNHEEIHQQLLFYQNSVGAVPGPQDCFLTLRGTKTLALRMERHSENAAAIATFLSGHRKVGPVNYPGLPEHPNHEVAARQMDDFGGMLSFELASDSMDDAIDFLSSTKLFSLAESLGGVESLIGHPASMTHASIPKAEREANGLRDGLLRLSVGIEHVDDLIEDLDRALGG
jgi:cystathionine gamma-lyase